MNFIFQLDLSSLFNYGYYLARPINAEHEQNYRIRQQTGSADWLPEISASCHYDKPEDSLIHAFSMSSYDLSNPHPRRKQLTKKKTAAAGSDRSINIFYGDCS